MQVREEKVSGSGPRSVSRNSRTTTAENFEHQQHITLGQLAGSRMTPTVTVGQKWENLDLTNALMPGLEKDSDPEKMEKIQKMLDEEEQLHALDPPRSVSPPRRILKSVRKDAHDILF